MTFRVEVDDTALRRAVAQLSRGLDAGADRAGMGQATDTARAIRENVPRRSGRLANTVDAVRVDKGGAVTYGGGLPYAHYIEGRAHAVRDGLNGADRAFLHACERVAEQEVNRI